MSTKKPEEPAEDESRGMLDDAASLDTTSLGIILTHTAQVNVILPQEVDEDLDDDAVVEGEVVDVDLEDVVLEPARVQTSDATDAVETDVADDEEDDDTDVAVEDRAEDLTTDEPIADRLEASGEEEALIGESDADAGVDSVEASDLARTEAAPALESIVIELPAEDVDLEQQDEVVEPEDEVVEPEEAIVESEDEAVEPEDEVVEPEDEVVEPEDEVVEPEEAIVESEDEAVEPEDEVVELEDEVVEPEPEPVVAVAPTAVPESEPAPVAPAAPVEPQREPVVVESAPAVVEPAPAAESAPTVAPEGAPADSAASATTPSAPTTSPIRVRSRKAQAATASEGRTPRADAVKEKTTATQPTPSSRRIDEFGDASRESADLLTADRLLDPSRLTKPEPEGAWSHFLYTGSGHRINIGDGRRARERKALTARIAAPLPGGAKFVPVLSRKGGVGKTAVTALLGMALADAREDRVIAVDANPDRGTLADRVARGHHTKSIRDLARIHDEVRGYHDISAIVARDATRLDVLASDSDPRIAEAFGDIDYRDVAEVAAHYYSLVLTDTGTGIVHSVMAAALGLADQMVIVSGLSVDEARLASETLTWLETNGFAEQAHDAIVVLNQSTPGAPLVRLNELESHFATRARKVVRMPYDPQIAGGGTIEFAALQPETRIAARELAALLVEGLRVKVA